MIHEANNRSLYIDYGKIYISNDSFQKCESIKVSIQCRTVYDFNCYFNVYLEQYYD